MGGVVLRPAVTADAATLARIHLAARASAGIPNLHPEDNVCAFHAGLIERMPTMVAEQDGAVLGYAAVEGDWLEHLYVTPEHHRQGVGARLLAWARSAVPSDLRFYVFAHNTRAIAFYCKHGAVQIAATDGRDNEERLPDVTLLIAKA